MKRTLFYMFFALLIISACTTISSILTGASAQSTSCLYIDPSVTSTFVGQTFTINVSVCNVVDLGLWQFQIEWNETILTCNDAEAGEGSYLLTWGADPYQVTVAGETTTPITGNATLCHLLFTADAAGISQLIFDDRFTHPSFDVVTEGEVEVTSIPGDINGDQVVDIFDAIILAAAYGSEPGDPHWNPDCDLNNDDVINIFDAIILAGHYGESQ